MFEQEYINCGKITHTDSSVSVFKDYYNSRYLPNIPGGRVVDAYWQGTHIVVRMDSGKSYVYSNFSNWEYYY